MKACTSDELKSINSLLFKKGESYAMRIGSVHAHEAAKAYPERYPINEDSLGIEIVSAFDEKGQTYDTVNKDQNESLGWLVTVLEEQLTPESVTPHQPRRFPDVGSLEYSRPGA